MANAQLQSVDLSEHKYSPQCDMCELPAVVIAQGCMDKQPVILCQMHLERGLSQINSYIKLWRQLNKKVMICGDCHRPILTLETHLEIKRLP